MSKIEPELKSKLVALSLKGKWLSVAREYLLSCWDGCTEEDYFADVAPLMPTHINQFRQLPDPKMSAAKAALGRVGVQLEDGLWMAAAGAKRIKDEEQATEEKEQVSEGIVTTAGELERLETEINTEAFEAFYSIGQKLLQIKTQRLYESAGFKSWSAYCASGRIEIVKKQADNLIRASELRPKLGTIGSHNWTERQMRELCKCETDNDAKRVAKKAVAQSAKTGEKVTAKLIAEIRDGADETGRADQRQDERLQSASLQNHLVKLSDTLTDYRCSLEQVESSQWGDVEIGVLSRLQRELTGLLALTKQN